MAQTLGVNGSGGLSGFGGDVALCQILLARPRRLHHLVYRAIARFQEAVREVIRHVVDALRLSERLQRAIIAVLPQEVLVFLHIKFAIE